MKLPLGSPVLRRVLDRITREVKREEAHLALKDTQQIERDELQERQQREREYFDRR